MAAHGKNTCCGANTTHYSFFVAVQRSVCVTRRMHTPYLVVHCILMVPCGSSEDYAVADCIYMQYRSYTVILH